MRTALSAYELTANVEALIGTSAFGQSLTGNALANVITGGDGNDVLDGGTGADALGGGRGDDVYYVDAPDDLVTENAAEGIDEVRTALSTYALTANVETLRGTVGTGQLLVGNGLANSILAGDGNDMLDGGAGADAMTGGKGDDIYYVDSSGDLVTEYAGEGVDEVRTTLAAYSLATNVENLTANLGTGQSLTGNALANILTGGDGNDVLDGGTGADQLLGGKGDDSYLVDSAGDVVVEAVGDGFDTVFTTVSFALGAALSVEELRVSDLASVNAINLTGNEFGQALAGNAGANILKGGGGDDRLSGGGGIDTLNGGTGADVMWGGTGDDFYVVDDPGDRAIEAAGEGLDTIFTSVNMTLEAGSEVEALRAADASALTALTLRGNEFGQVLAGNAGANLLKGGGGDDYLEGRMGGDTLDGGTGNDVMIGGVGDDYYFVDSLFDRVIESSGEGSDTLFTAVSLALQDDLSIEALRALDAAATVALNLTGNGFGQIIAGNAGDNRLSGGGGDDYLEGRDGGDTLDGGSGNDVLIGGAGNDYFLIEGSNDRVLESAGGGVDVIFTATSFGLEAGAEIEELRLADPAAAATFNLWGNEFGQVLSGNAGDNFLSGGGGDDYIEARAGNDTINGGSGNDVLIGGPGSDLFVFADTGGAERIVDFVSGTDRIDLHAFGISVAQVTAVSAAGDTTLSIDTDFNGVPDFTILLSGSGVPLLGDYIF